jgi:hypothetical protein
VERIRESLRVELPNLMEIEDDLSPAHGPLLSIGCRVCLVEARSAPLPQLAGPRRRRAGKAADIDVSFQSLPDTEQDCDGRGSEPANCEASGTLSGISEAKGYTM